MDPAPAPNSDRPLERAPSPSSRYALHLPTWKISPFQIPEPGGSPLNEIESIAVSDEAGLTAVSSRASLFILESSSIPHGKALVPRKIRGDLFFPKGLSFSPDGSYLAGGLKPMRDRPERFEIIRCEDIATMPHPPSAARISHSGVPNVSCWSPDGTLLAIGTLDGQALVFDVSELSSGKAPRQIKTVGRSRSCYFVMSLSFSPDSQALVICYCDGRVQFSSLRSNESEMSRIAAAPRTSLPAGDALEAARLPAVPDHAAWWKMLKPSRGWFLSRSDDAGAKVHLPYRFGNTYGSLSPDGTILALSGEIPESFWDSFRGKSWLGDRHVHNAAIKVLDLTEIDKHGRPVLREIASYPLNQEVHSIQFLADGEHILIATQGCGYDIIEAGSDGLSVTELYPPTEVPHIVERQPGQGSDLQAQLRILRLTQKNGKSSLEEVSTLVQDCTWLQAAASRRAGTICAGAYDGYGYIFQRDV